MLGTLSISLACAKPKGESAADKKSYVRGMRADALKDLYAAKPEARKKGQSTAGYAVFSNIESKFMFVGAGSGYGVAVDNATGKETFMKMAKLHGGFGMGIQDFRGDFIFKKPATLKRFVEEGWEFGGGVDASAKSEEKGGAITQELSATLDPEIYQMTKSGIALSATVAGTKYWKDDELN